MNTMKRWIGLAVAVLGLVVGSAGRAEAGMELLLNGGFGTGTFAGWDVGIRPGYDSGGRPYNIDPNGDGWVISGSTTGSPAIAPISGFTAFNGFDGGVANSNGAAMLEVDLTFFLNQSFIVAGPLDAATLAFTYDINGGPYSGYSSRGTPVEARVFSANILDSAGSLLTTLYSKSVASASSHLDPEVPLTSVSLDLTTTLNALGAGSYKLEFRELIPQYYTGAGNFAIDNISLNVTPSAAAVPEPSTLAAGAFGIALCGGWWLRRRKAA